MVAIAAQVNYRFSILRITRSLKPKTNEFLGAKTDFSPKQSDLFPGCLGQHFIATFINKAWVRLFVSDVNRQVVFRGPG